MAISASDVGKLRKMTGAGMMDCKKALTEADGDFDKAVKIIRERGQAIANKRADRETTEGVALAKTSADGKIGYLLSVGCETDFVAKNDDFVKFAESILDVAVENDASDLDALKGFSLEGKTVDEKIIEQTGIIGEKISLAHFDKVSADAVIAYIHGDKKLSTLVGFTKAGIDEQIYKDVAMQVAAMDPVAVNESQVSDEVKERELEIGRNQAIKEGKPEAIVDKIAQGKLQKFYKDNTLLNQAFIKEGKMSVKQYLEQADKELTVTEFKRFSLKQ